MRHGPIVPVDASLPFLVLAPLGHTYEKVVSNIEKVKAHRGILITVVSDGDRYLEGNADYLLPLPYASECVAPTLKVVSLQFLACHIALRRGCDVGQSRNLVKRATVR